MKVGLDFTPRWCSSEDDKARQRAVLHAQVSVAKLSAIVSAIVIHYRHHKVIYSDVVISMHSTHLPTESSYEGQKNWGSVSQIKYVKIVIKHVTRHSDPHNDGCIFLFFLKIFGVLFV